MYPVTLSVSYFPAQTDGMVLPTSVGSALRDAARRASDAIFLRDTDDQGQILRTWTNRAMLDASEQLAKALRSRFEIGERIIVWAPNVAEWIILKFAAGLAGLVLVPANPSFREGELRHVIEQSRASAIFASSDYRGRRLLDIARSMSDKCPTVRGVFDLGAVDQFSVDPAGSSDLPDVHPDDAAQIQYTSGTTGTPKGAVISHGALTNNARLAFERLAAKPGQTLLHLMPLFHNGGCGFLLMGALQHDLSIVLPPKFDPRLVVRLVEQESVVMLLGVPTMLVGMMEALEQEQRDVSSLKLVMTGGASVPSEMVRNIRQRLGCDFAILYGQTEASANITVTWLDDTDDDIASTVGQPIPHTELSIRDTVTGEVTPTGVAGEICMRSFTCMIGYNENPDATALAIDSDRWLHTGDLGTLDARGYLRVTGRLKDMIVRGGENIYPAEIENRLIAHPSVAEAAVVGIPDDRWGEVVACFVRVASGERFDPEDLTSYCRRYLAPAKIPVHWRLVESLPLTASGKIQKFVLREAFINGER